MKITRRDALKLGLMGAGATVLPVGVFVRTIGTAGGAPSASPPVQRFRQPLAIPQVLSPYLSDQSGDYYRIIQRVSQAQIIPGKRTYPLWTYNGVTPGPTILAQRDRSVFVTQVNRLGVPTTTHLHGADVHPVFDGHPLDLVHPGNEWMHWYPNTQPAATLWYHDHTHHATARNVYMGLAGFYLLSDSTEAALPLPKGAFDIPLAIQDRLFNADGSLAYAPGESPGPSIGQFGDVILVNGVPFPFLRVTRRKYRFRLLNGSNARPYTLSLSTGAPLTVVSTEDSFLEHPVQVAELPMQAAERYGVVIDFSQYPIGTQVVLRNTFVSTPWGDPFDPAKTSQLMRFDVVDDASDPSSVPADLAPLPSLPQAVTTRDWVFDFAGGAWTINGLPFDHHRIDARPALGTTEIWRFTNNTPAWLHPVHPHAAHFLVLDRDGQPPPPYERGLKDTVALAAGQTVRVLMKFEHWKGKFVFHCHNLEHEHHEQMTQFEVV